MMIRKATLSDLPALCALALELWPEHTAEDLTEEFKETLENNAAQFFLLFAGDAAVGFAQCGLRHDYVEGTESSPIGYLEGLYVKEAFRRCGCAKQLLAACEEWTRSQSCTEFASDCELGNDVSLAFHLGAGFTEANRIVCFTKKLT